MQITLINTDDESWAIGMRSISSVLREGGYKTTMVFAGASDVPMTDQVIREIAAVVGDSEIIGISSMSRGSARAKTLIEGLRPLGRLIVWGGVHPTLFPGDCTGHADLVCRGEGEEFMLDLAERVASGRGFADIPNGGYLSDGETVLNDLRPLIADLDDLPFLDFAFENEYVLDQTGALVPNTRMKQKGIVLFSGSRGCNNSCAYCSNSRLKVIYRGKGRFVRKMSIPRFVEAARVYQQLFPQLTYFYFTDEDFFARSEDEMREFAGTYPDAVGLPFECMASPRQIIEEKMALATKAGMHQLDVGLESGSERVRREVFHRHITDEMQCRAASAIHAHAPESVIYFLILGNPYEQRQDLIDGVRLLEKLPYPFFLRAYNLVLLPGTNLYEKAVEDGIITGIDDSAAELDLLSGYDHRTHDWKRQNVYLNGLISLMGGKSRRWRMGWVPRRLVTVLTSPRAVDYCDSHPLLGDMVVSLGLLGIRLPGIINRLLEKVR
ncbi:B12-binding domain-containing radical SAM protein [Methanoculleus horonobensis]|uniref:B12-binding domain-containing radical SAM protein n=1 Tax=Methanoculleus horonobensis TaxID=528314 RepID=UPI00082E85F9|nr:radical SAM protein [Methanoculleus horonobensis]